MITLQTPELSWTSNRELERRRLRKFVAIPVITVNGYGQITAVSTVPAAGGSGAGSAAGTLAAIPATCSSGALYVATDQPASQQIYTCSSSNTWTQYMSLGGSGALAFTNGALDMVTSVVPRLPLRTPSQV